MLRCDKCGERAVYLRRYSGQRFCREHFIEYFEGRAARTMKQGKMLEEGDKIGVGVSGGKDSLTTLFLLKKLEEKYDLELHAIAVDEGIPGYREETLRAAGTFCARHGVTLHRVSFKDSFGFALSGVEKKRNACTYCGVLRRKLLNDKAKELGLNKLATGHNLDDEVQAIMMNYLSGDPERIARYGSRESSADFVQRIKPLAELPEKEVALYALLRGLGASFAECPYADEGLRSRVRDWLNALEKEHAGIKFSVLGGYRKMQPYLQELASREIKRCERCGSAASGVVCKACQLLEEIKI
jgi:uncharacterized protein (TIGR00269 family)